MTTATDTDTDTMVLSADDVQALRGADSVSFHVHQGKAFISATLRTHAERILTAREQRIFAADARRLSGDREREIPCHWRAFGYAADGGTGWRGQDEPSLTAFAMVGCSQYSTLWATTASLISAGDTLTLVWAADNNTEIIEKAGLHADELTLIATNARGRERAFHVDSCINPDNSARMIRRYGH